MLLTWHSGWARPGTSSGPSPSSPTCSSLFAVVGDLSRDHRLSGPFKAAWLLYLIFVPFATVQVYLVVRGPGMQRRRERREAFYDHAADYYLHGPGLRHSPADEISKAKALTDAGIISAGEYQAIKFHALNL